MQLNSCSVLISTSKNYQKVTLAFFHFFFLNFPNDFELFLVSDEFNNEDKKELRNDINLILKKDIWSNRVKFALDKIKSEYVLFFFEDFIIKDKVDMNKINKILNYIKFKNIDYLKLNNSSRELKNYTYVPQTNIMIGEIPEFDPYRLPLQASIWNRNFFKNVLSFDKNPWNFERDISNLINLNKYKIFSIHKNQPIKYPRRGIVIRGKLVKKELLFLNKNNYYLETNLKIESYIENFFRDNAVINLLRFVKNFFTKFSKNN